MEKTTLKFLDDILNMFLDIKGVPGFSVAIWEKGKVVFDKSYGLANIKTKEKLSPKHKFHIASHSKTFTAAAIMKLALSGQLSLDDKISKYIPEAKKSYNKITIRHLLGHLGGVYRDGYDDSNYWETFRKFPEKSEILDILETTTPVIKPNYRFKYSNFGFSLLGMIIENVSGKGFEDYIRSNIIENHPDISPSYNSNAKPYTYGHTNKNTYGKFYPVRPDIDARDFNAAGGFCTTASALCKFYGDLMTGKILPKKAVAELTKATTEVPQDPNVKYGLGYRSYFIDKLRWIGHGGAMQGQLSRTIFNPEKQLVISVMCNNHNSDEGGLSAMIAKLITSNHKNFKYLGLFYGLWRRTCFFTANNRLYRFCPDEATDILYNNYAEKNTKGEWITKECAGGDSYGEKIEIISKDHINLYGRNIYTKQKFTDNMKMKSLYVEF
ncbi:MAG: beta-lactamase family protein [Lactobacillus sp.]|jgi:CubicO group peptidase (beta-lactamase class C family)|nr:beta-lactamase family protein [Lactobacillus sp.]